MFLPDKKILIACMAVAVLSVSGTAAAELARQGNTSEEDLGIRKESLYDEQKVMPGNFEYSSVEPGKSKRIERAFENSPPLIPHSISGMLPIMNAGNKCVDCHMPDAAAAMKSTPMPKSHFIDFETGKNLEGKLDGKRFDCIQCHVPQADTAEPVKNVFRKEFRNKSYKTRSDLIDSLNEGVTAE